MQQPLTLEQAETEPLASVRGKPVVEIPADLYIPPEALEVMLDAFEGPLDLLLYLIRKQKLDILDLPIVAITNQYMQYISLMEQMQFELAAEYLVMAATLAEIKSRLLLPRTVVEEDEEIDPRAMLVLQLQAYEAVKIASEQLDERPREEREFWSANAHKDEALKPVVIPPDVTLSELLNSLQELLERAEHFEHHQIEREALSTRERMSILLDRLTGEQFVAFQSLLCRNEGRAGVVVSLLALLELIRESLVEVQQISAFSQIHVRAKT